ncbi:MAG: hypothetical protein HQL45_02970 [Alphaproteobacteria bacterium]|nr:hypothetical protein [Alphaproteobacteria bacterium]
MRLQEAWFFYAASHIQAGQQALVLGNLDSALTSFREAARIDPFNLAAWGGIGEALSRQGNAEAAAAFAHLIGLVGSKAGDLGSLAGQLFAHGWNHAALALWQAAEAGDPTFVAWQLNQAAALKLLGRTDEARQSAWAALKTDPTLDAAHRLLGEISSDAGDLSAAIRHFSAVLAPDAQIMAHLAQTYLLMGDGNAAAEAFQKAAEQDGIYASQALMALHYRTDISVQDIIARHRSWGARFPAPKAPAWKHAQGLPLRLGFVSSDFRHHATGIFLPPLLGQRQRCGWQAVLYSNTKIEDGFTDKFKSLCEDWRDIRSLSDEAAADMVRADGIDILIDLNGHTAGNRLGLFALRPAPVQMAYLDYVSTTGLAQIDYRIHDRIHLTEAEAALYSEKPLWMEGDIFVYEPPAYAPDVAPPPCLTNGYVTFGSFNAAFKIGEPSIALWCAVLNEIRDARFVMASPNLKYAATQERMQGLFRKHGIETHRLTLLGEADHAQQLARYALVDLVLDSLPYSGGLTTCEALWMGVPVLTLSGDRVAGRHSTSHLSAIGHPELIAASPDDFVERACRLGRDVKNISALRNSLRDEMRRSILCDVGGYADRFTAALREINFSSEK